ncbi:MAG: hypothetical protein HOC71_11060, partial [Candidatus Latescibacteria bacterium]|nr:hypothetical protein [Candidatus Latescibacterota bacterium]
MLSGHLYKRLSRFMVTPLYFICFMIITSTHAGAVDSDDPGLLFYLSGNNGFSADYAEGNPEPSFLNAVEIIPDGMRGPGFRIPN